MVGMMFFAGKDQSYDARDGKIWGSKAGVTGVDAN
jgi:hypothetical protein